MVPGDGEDGLAASVTPWRLGAAGDKADPDRVLELILAGHTLTEPLFFQEPRIQQVSGQSQQDKRHGVLACVHASALVGSAYEEGLIFIEHLPCPWSQIQCLISSFSLQIGAIIPDFSDAETKQRSYSLPLVTQVVNGGAGLRPGFSDSKPRPREATPFPEVRLLLPQTGPMTKFEFMKWGGLVRESYC